ncbi:MAG TPA: extensin family protein [Tessaracoccus flavescens]|uniref:Extensin family protein n=1 Tax=Tessaracoccus flavescens TaxID=399497 RepID=A0A921EQS5_9ACTN|nr:extensin family protein [Tessaracoccus flavescens]
MVNRRAFLVGAGALAVTACSRGGDPTLPGFEPQPDHGQAPNCRNPESLTSFTTLGGAPLRYEVSGVEQPFKADPRYIEQLEAWAADWVAVSGLGTITAISSYGAHVDKCNSWHQAGRAFDFAVVEHGDSKISCRYDLFGDDEVRLKQYWRLAASVAKHFTYTLTYRYNQQHHNHIHIDNGVSGYGATSFDVQSPAHVTLVQGVARYVFGQDCPQEGLYDDSTKDAVRAVQRSLGIGNPLADANGWVDFLDGAAAAA